MGFKVKDFPYELRLAATHKKFKTIYRSSHPSPIDQVTKLFLKLIA
jgi:hypothetical protein